VSTPQPAHPEFRPDTQEPALSRSLPAAPEAPVPRRALDGSPIYTVSELTRQIREALEQRVGSVWVTGEVSNLRVPASGHCYFTLKDAQAQINVVMWRTVVALLRFELRDGLSVVVQGELTVYEPRGQYQIVARRAEPLGVGALQLAFLQLKERLAREGLFEERRKRPLPFLPRRIAIVTSPTGAAIRDMLKVVYRRLPQARVVVCPVRVQGEGAGQEIAQMIRVAGGLPEVDVIIVGRGGGSLEDLWPFNEEVVARAIAASGVPVISAVGHETDFTIADFAADVRALTPTDAGVRVVPDAEELADRLWTLAGRLGQALLGRIRAARQRLEAAARRYVMKRPLERVRRHEQRLDDLCQQLFRDMTHTLALQRQRLGSAAGRLESLSPLAVLRRGYSITFREPEGTVLRDAAEVRPGDLVRTRLAKGEFRARAVEPPAPRPRRSPRRATSPRRRSGHGKKG